MAFKPKGKIVTGEEAKVKLAGEHAATGELETLEIDFILTKLRQAQYTGAEFELFYKVWVKLSNLKK
tara:strand:+ start:204 stop:404 length:201 start_codon:yes stop_codon:yes gene_type:complete